MKGGVHYLALPLSEALKLVNHPALAFPAERGERPDRAAPVHVPVLRETWQVPYALVAVPYPVGGREAMIAALNEISPGAVPLDRCDPLAPPTESGGHPHTCDTDGLRAADASRAPTARPGDAVVVDLPPVGCGGCLGVDVMGPYPESARPAAGGQAETQLPKVTGLIEFLEVVRKVLLSRYGRVLLYRDFYHVIMDCARAEAAAAKVNAAQKVNTSPEAQSVTAAAVA